MKFRIVVLLPFFCSLSVWAQTSNRCNGVLELSGRDFGSQEVIFAAAEKLANDHCSGSSRKEGVSISIPVAALVDKLPSDLVGTFGSSREKLHKMCENFSSWKSLNYTNTVTSSLAVRESIAAWSSCIGLSDADINIESGSESLVISINRGEEDADFTGVVVSNNSLACTTQVMVNGKLTSVNAADSRYYPIRLLPSDTNVTCIRTPHKEEESGDKIFPPVDLTVLTTRGRLLLPIPWNRQFSANTAAEMTDRLIELQKKTNALESHLSKIRVAESSEVKERNIVQIPNKFYKQWTGTDECPNGQYVSGLEVTGRRIKGGELKGLQTLGAFKLKCKPIISTE